MDDFVMALNRNARAFIAFYEFCKAEMVELDVEWLVEVQFYNSLGLRERQNREKAIREKFLTGDGAPTIAMSSAVLSRMLNQPMIGAREAFREGFESTIKIIQDPLRRFLRSPQFRAALAEPKFREDDFETGLKGAGVPVSILVEFCGFLLSSFDYERSS